VFSGQAGELNTDTQMRRLRSGLGVVERATLITFATRSSLSRERLQKRPPVYLTRPRDVRRLRLVLHWHCAIVFSADSVVQNGNRNVS